MRPQSHRQRRISVEIPVMVTTVLSSIDASIMDLNDHGALITGCSLAAGMRFQIEYLDQTLYARCRWSEIDRMGVEFFYPLTDGPLFERLMIAQAAQLPDDMSVVAVAYRPMQIRPIADGAFSRITQTRFGRRVA